jgi:hypothetical protein
VSTLFTLLSRVNASLGNARYCCEGHDATWKRGWFTTGVFQVPVTDGGRPSVGAGSRSSPGIVNIGGIWDAFGATCPTRLFDSPKKRGADRPIGYRDDGKRCGPRYSGLKGVLGVGRSIANLDEFEPSSICPVVYGPAGKRQDLAPANGQGNVGSSSQVRPVKRGRRTEDGGRKRK